jgi:hypothetical protein
MTLDFSLRPLDPETDAAVVHDWVTRPYAAFWGMASATVDDVRAAYAELTASPHHEVLLGSHDGRAAFLTELYDPAHHELASVYDVRPGDLGMHLLVAPPTEPRHGFTRAVMRTALDRCFADPTVTRVVVEPDVRNTKIHALNAAVGFTAEREVTLSDKRALLSFCTRDAHATTRQEALA